MRDPSVEFGQPAYSELFDAAQVALDWMKDLCPRDRPIAKFNRLQDAIDRVREAHQMHGFAWPAPSDTTDRPVTGPGNTSEPPSPRDQP